MLAGEASKGGDDQGVQRGREEARVCGDKVGWVAEGGLQEPGGEQSRSVLGGVGTVMHCAGALGQWVTAQ